MTSSLAIILATYFNGVLNQASPLDNAPKTTISDSSDKHFGVQATGAPPLPGVPSGVYTTAVAKPSSLSL